MMGERFRDFELKPEMRVRMFDYTREGKRVRYSSLETDDEILYFSKTAESQFYHLLGLSVKALESQPYWQERDRLIEEKKNERAVSGTPIILRVVGKRIWSVVTEIHVLVRHTEVWNVVEEVLKARYGTFLKRDPLRVSGGLYTKYLLPKLWQDDTKMCAGLTVFNSASGQGSLRIGAYYEIIVCSNGLIAPEYNEVYSRVHKGNKDAILTSLRSRLEQFLDTFKPVDLSKAQETLEVASILQQLPIAKKYKMAVSNSLPLECSRFDIASSLSTIAKSGLAPPNIRIELEILSFQILEGGLLCPKKE